MEFLDDLLGFPSQAKYPIKTSKNIQASLTPTPVLIMSHLEVAGMGEYEICHLHVYVCVVGCVC